MRSRLLQLAALLALALKPLIGFAAPPLDAQAQIHKLSQSTAQLIESRQNSSALNAVEFAQRERILDRLAALEIAAESGQLMLGPVQRQRMVWMTEMLHVLPVEARLIFDKQAKANGTLTGTIRDAGGTPLTLAGSVTVQATDFSSQATPSGAGIIASTSISNTGVYTLTLPPGKYHVRTFLNNQGFINQAFGFGDCTDGNYCPRYVGTIVTVPDGGSVGSIDMNMPLGGRISGNVKRSDTSANLAGIPVRAAKENGFGGFSAITDASGNYTISGLAPGRYRVHTANAPVGFLNEAANNIACGDQDCALVLGSALVTVSGTATTPGIDFTLDPGAGSIAGIITETGTGLPIADGGNQDHVVYLISEDQATLLSSPMAADGSYSFTRLRPASYRVVAQAPGRIGKVVVNGLPAVTTRNCEEAFRCDPIGTGGSIVVALGAAISGLNFSLDIGASVSGTVVAAAGGAPVANASVVLTNDVSQVQASTDASGNFTARGLVPGVYYAYADAVDPLTGVSLNFVQTWLGDISCRGFQCSNVGVPITVGATSVITGLVFRMPQGGTLSGTILDAATAAIAPRSRTRIELFDSSARMVVQISAGATGYSLTGLQPGAYKAVFASTSVAGWVDTAFGGAACPRGGCDQSVLPTVFVTAGAVTAGINATLPRGPRVLGTVVDAGSGLPIRPRAFGGSYSGFLALNNNLSNYAGFGVVDAAGVFVSRTGFPAGPYFLSTFLLRNNTPIGGGYIDELFDNINCPYASCGLTSGTPINVATADVGGIGLALNQGGGIGGTVTNSVGSVPLAGVEIRAFNGAGDQVAQARSNSLGNYLISGLPAGSYFLTTFNRLGFQDERYDNQSCEPFCNPVGGIAVNVVGTVTTSGRDFALSESVVISGIVTNGGLAANVAVEIYGQIGNLLRSTTTDGAGAYRFADLAAGRFYLRTRNAIGRTDDLYYLAGNANNTQPTKPDCVGLACQVRRGTPIDLNAGGSFTLANLALLPPGRINGQITLASTSNPLSGVRIALYDARGALVGEQTSSPTGAFSFSALAAGNYHAATRATPGFVDETFPNTPCSASCNGLNGSPIVVATGATVNAVNIALAAGASISGTVRNNAAVPVAGATVQVYDAAATPIAQIATNPSGNYEISNVANGNFFVRTQNSLGFVNEVFNNNACAGYCDILNGNAVVISGGAAVGLIDFALDAGGSIAGRVTNASTTLGIALAEVQAIDVNGLIAGRVNTNASGDYTIGGLPPGNYKLRSANSAGFVNQVYRTPTPLSCSPAPCVVTNGTTIAVAGATTGINLALVAGGTISGTAADLFNNPLPSGDAVLLDVNGIGLMTHVIANGLFEFNGLANGSYYVLIRNNSGLIDLLFPNIPCPAGACNIVALGTPIVLSGATHHQQLTAVANIDLRLPAGRAIAGKVTRSGVPLGGVRVSIFDASGAVVAFGTSDALGDYVTDGTLPAGAGITYFAATTSETERGVGDGLVAKAWNDVPCMFACGISQVGTAINLPTGVAPLSGINFNLQPGGGLRGIVSGQTGPLSLVTVIVVDLGGKIVGTAQSDSLGAYRVDGLIPGNYFAYTSNVLGLQNRVFGGSLCAPGCNPAGGMPIVVAGIAFADNINFNLAPQNTIFGNGFEN